MKKNTVSKKGFWLAVAGVLVLLAVCVAAYFLFTLYGTEGVPLINSGKTLSPEELLTQAALYNPTPPANAVFKPADKLIIKMVNFDQTGNISEIETYVPAAIADGIVYVDGRQVDVTRTQSDKAYIFQFSVPLETIKKSLSFAIEKDGKLAATCSLAHTDTLVVSGDCIF